MKIGDFTIGQGRTFVVGEVGINHGGRMDLAHRLIDVAYQVGADAVKFQTFRSDELGCTPDIAACELPLEAWPELAAHARERGIIFFSTPFDPESVDLLDPLVPCFKIASGEITNEPLLRHVASKGKPVILSTGMATMDEVHQTWRWFDRKEHVLLHCVSAYPTPPEEANLLAIRMLMDWEMYPFVGLSDHSYGIAIPIAAVALGACVIEKHLTLDPTLPGPDQRMSTIPDVFAQMVREIRVVEQALGDGVKRVMPSEEKLLRVARRDPQTGRRPA